MAKRELGTTDGTSGMDLAMDWWDCECEEDYIHETSVKKCQKCGYEQDDCPTSRVNEVEEMLSRENS